jgi:hypothetical protein
MILNWSKLKRKPLIKKWDAEYRESRAHHDGMQACKIAIEKIAAGHNDPRALAVTALELFKHENHEN